MSQNQKISSEQKIEGIEGELNIDCNYPKKSKILLGAFKDAPKYIQDNEYIIKGYLLNCNTYSKIFKSLFICHNETINIWSHLLGSLFFMFLIWYTAIYITNYNSQLVFVKKDISLIEKKYLVNDSFSTNISSNEINNIYELIKDLKLNLENFDKKKIYKKSLIQLSSINKKILEFKKINDTNNNFFCDNFSLFRKDLFTLNQDVVDLIYLDNKNIGLNLDSNEKKNKKSLVRWPLFIIIISAILCLSFSSIFHCLGNMSATHYNILTRFDYGGISLLISGSCYPPYYYFFYYSQKLKIFYLSEITIFGLGTFFYSLTDDFNKPTRRALRGWLYLIFGLCTGIPIIHMSFFADNIKGYSPGIKFLNWYLGGFCYIIGALIYIMRLPEKKCPGIFDYIGASHQIFHILVFFGALFHFLGSLDAYNYRFEKLDI